MKNLLIIISLVFLISSCKSLKKTEQQQDTSPDICESMSFNSKPVDNISTDYYSIDSLTIDNNCLVIWVTYSGGCGDADFEMYYTDRIIETNPPKTKLRLQLTDNDPCRAIVQQKLFYNLSFFDDYAADKGLLIELVDSNKSVLYKK